MRNYRLFKKYSHLVPRTKQDGTTDTIKMYLDREIRDIEKNTWEAETISIDEVFDFDTFFINNKSYKMKIFEPIFDSKGFRTPKPNIDSTEGINHYEMVLKSVSSNIKECEDSTLYIYDKSLSFKKCKIESVTNSIKAVLHYQITTISPLKQLDNTNITTIVIMDYIEGVELNQTIKICQEFYKIEEIENVNKLNIWFKLYLKEIGDTDNAL